MEAKRERNSSHLRRALFILSLITFTSLVSATSSSSEKVTLELYYETLCPYCANLIVNYLYKIFDTGIIDITNLKLIPYGNAKIKPPNSTIVCQHGPDECLLNTIEACAIDTWPDVNEHFPFVYCVESLIYEGKRTEWETCFEKLGLDPKPVNDCYKNGRGKEVIYFAVFGAFILAVKYLLCEVHVIFFNCTDCKLLKEI
ncbi:OLC1v1006316C1 [Oldenlandia corymbosa var. corymbosa]|uniref:OLC1v1006316C1 n=1 Tax=Oldenlandia corymbosa var. corymbosa TaxID=529605 RepID=A0AAV1DGS3_OLDCO|nr:OLC1v1006316C1 [Oldenlandia corymbosa var. corymbosa]